MGISIQIGRISLLATNSDIEIVPIIARSFFSGGPIAVDGHVTVTTEPAKLSFDSPNIEIIGAERIINAVSGELTFASPNVFAAGYSGIINVPAAEINFSSPDIVAYSLDNKIDVIPQRINFSARNITVSGNHTIVSPDKGVIAFDRTVGINAGVWTIALIGGFSIFSRPAGMRLYGSDITITGHETIVAPTPAGLRFSASPDTFSGDIIYPSPVELQFSAFAEIVLGEVVRHTPAELKFSISDVIVFGDVLVPTYMSMTFPEFEMDCFSGGSIEAEIPQISLKGKLFPGKIASLNGNLPKLSMTATSGGYIDINIPVIEYLEIQASNPIVAELAAEIQSLDLYISALHGGHNSAAIVLPSLQLSCDVITGETANLSSSLLIPHFISTGFTGEVAKITAQLPMLKSRMSGGRTGPGIMSLEMGSLKLSMESGRVDEGVLRHIRGKIR